MILRKKSDIMPVSIANCMGGEGIVSMEKLLLGPEEMHQKGRAYVRHTLGKGVTIGKHTHQGEMESMVIISGQGLHIINGEEQILNSGDVIVAEPGDTHEIKQMGDQPLVLIAQVLYE